MKRHVVQIAILTVVLAGSMQLATAQQQILLDWEVTNHTGKNELTGKWIPAQVPGAVQLDYAKANNWPPFYYAENWKDYRWMEDSWWTYRAKFPAPSLKSGERLWFVSRGIDYEFQISINGQKIYQQEGMFTPVHIDLTDYLKKENELFITVFPAPKIEGAPDTRDNAAQSVKPAVSYGWDWHPRLIPLGIWDETFLEIKPEKSLIRLIIKYSLNDDFSAALMKLIPEGNHLDGTGYRWDLKGPDGQTVLQKSGVLGQEGIEELVLTDPELWWPHDHGDQPLYTSEFSILDGEGHTMDVVRQKTGFRRIQLVMNPGTWNEPAGFPKGRSRAPITLEVNGREIFCKGTNWVNPEIFPGIITPERYDELTNRALEANFNLLRIWGGGIVNKESFYDLCDRKGIMVWTEFPLACNNYEGTEKYLTVLKQESGSIITRVSQHPSNVLWCGGNELFNSWSKMTDQSLAIRLLNSQCYLLDPGTPFLPTSPVVGMGHGYYLFQDRTTGEEVFQWMPRARKTAYTEFGMPGPASVEILKKIIPEEQLFPPEPGTSWESHHAFHAWGPTGDNWLQKGLLVDYFGELKNLEEMVANGQWLQSEGYKCIYEEARRQKPYCSMALNWCYNEPWPTAANNSLISYPDHPKPAFYSVSQSCRPVLASARIPKFKWKAGEVFTCDLFMLNDQYKEISPGSLSVKIIAGSEEIEILRWDYPGTGKNLNLPGPTARFRLPRFGTDRFTLILEVDGHPEWNSVYILDYES